MTRLQLTDDGWDFIEPYLPIGGFGPYPERLRQQFEGVIWRFRTGGQWREKPGEFGAWPTVRNRFRQWRDAGVFEALAEGLIAEAVKRGEVDLSLVSVDSTTARAHHDAAGMHLGQDVITALEKAAAEEQARQKGAAPNNKTGRAPETTPSGKSGRRSRDPDVLTYSSSTSSADTSHTSIRPPVRRRPGATTVDRARAAYRRRARHFINCPETTESLSGDL